MDSRRRKRATKTDACTRGMVHVLGSGLRLPSLSYCLEPRSGGKKKNLTLERKRGKNSSFSFRWCHVLSTGASDSASRAARCISAPPPHPTLPHHPHSISLKFCNRFEPATMSFPAHQPNTLVPTFSKNLFVCSFVSSFVYFICIVVRPHCRV